MTAPLAWFHGAALPALSIWWTGPDGGLLDLATATLNEVRIGNPGKPALKVKTAGVTLQTGSGTAGNGTPNALIAWGNDDLDLQPGRYVLQLDITMAGLTRIHAVDIAILPVVLPAA